MCRKRTTCLAVLLSLPIAAASLQYPSAPRGNVVDDYHGTRIADPYRWLENPDSPESRKWIQAENALTESYLKTVPDTDAIKSQLMKLWTPVTYPSGGFAARGGRYFFLRRDPGKNQPILYWRTDRADSQPKILLDPNTLRADGTAALDSWSLSRDGKMLAYGIARAGSDWQDIQFRSVDDCKDLTDKLQWSKFSSLEWSPDGSGIYYTRFPEPAQNSLLTAANYNQELRFHTLRTAQSSDRLVYSRPDHKTWEFDPIVTEDGTYLVIEVHEGTRPENLVFYRRLKEPAAKTVELNSTFDAQYQFLANDRAKFYFETTDGAPRGRVISIDTSAANRKAEVIPQKQAVLDQAVILDDSMYLNYQQDVVAHLYTASLNTRELREVALPGKGTASWAEHGPKHGPGFFWFGSFTEPTSLYAVAPNATEGTRYGTGQLPFSPQSFETRQVFYNSKDGTKIPMFLIGRRGFKANPETPCLMWGYGGFDIAVTPQYSPLFLEWVQGGGLVAVANLRGGSEYGEAWHQAGMKLHKQNVFDDFIAAAQWLTENRYTSTAKLAIYGRSNGGLLIGAVLNQRPDLFGAAIAGVGVMDMLRFDKFTVGQGWTSDYGSPGIPLSSRRFALTRRCITFMRARVIRRSWC
jgi:prolyl oligopeptidase